MHLAFLYSQVEHKLGSFFFFIKLILTQHYKETSLTNGLRPCSHPLSTLMIYSLGDQNDSGNCPQRHYTEGGGEMLS